MRRWRYRAWRLSNGSKVVCVLDREFPPSPDYDIQWEHQTGDGKFGVDVISREDAQILLRGPRTPCEWDVETVETEPRDLEGGNKMLTPELTQAFWAHMLKEFDASVVQKGDSDLMKVVATVLDAFSVQDKEQFMLDFVTTLGRAIYIPFKIGIVGKGRWSLWAQARVCGHECGHVMQGNREGWATYDSRYVTSSSFRAGYEAECYGIDMELEFWRLGSSGFDPFRFAQERPLSLKNYGCKEAEIEQAQQMLTIRAGLVAQGVVETRAAQVAIPWLEANVSGLREV